MLQDGGNMFNLYNKKSKDIKVDGFRKGKCPKNIYLQKFGVESLYMDAIDVAAGDAYTKVIRENKLVPVCEPKMDVKEIDEKHVKFIFTIITKPEVKLGKYKDLGIKNVYYTTDAGYAYEKII